MKARPLFFHPAALFILFILAGAFFADWLAPYGHQDEVRTHSYHPPTRLHFWDSEGKFHFRPFVYATKAVYDENATRLYPEEKTVPCFLHFGGRKLARVDEPARLYLLGADSRGRDLFSRILYGARLSLSMALLGAGVAALAGFVVGAVSGYFGGALDAFLMRLAEFFIMIPGIYLLLALRSALPPELGSARVYALIVSILALIGWGSVARVIRGLVLSIREKDFILAAKVLGRNDFDILSRHVFPHTFSYLAIVVSVSVPGYILGESALSILGLGIQEPDVSWGNLLTESLAVAHLRFHPWAAYPAIFIMLTLFCFNRLGDLLSAGRKAA